MEAVSRSIDDYIKELGGVLTAHARNQYPPLHFLDDEIAPELKSIKRKLYPRQGHVVTSAVKAIREHRNRLWICGECGTGKGGLPSTKVLTPSGWTTLGEISVGDEVTRPAGGAARVTGVYRRGVMPMFKVEMNDGSFTHCSDDHLWCVNTSLRRQRGRPWRVKQLRDIRSNLRNVNNQLLNFIPMVVPVEFAVNGCLPVDPYLLGVLLGDGGMASGGLTVTSADEEILRAVEQIVPWPLKLRQRGVSGIHFGISAPRGHGNDLIKALRGVGLYGCGSTTKFVPPEYLTATVQDRIDLLAGLLDTDGSVSGSYGIEYTSTSQMLANAARDIVHSLGGRARMSDRITYCTHNGEKVAGARSYRLYISLPRWIRPFRLTRKLAVYQPGDKYPPLRVIKDVESIGDHECICISIDAEDGLYVTDDYIVTHNTTVAISTAHIAGRGKYRAIVTCPAHIVEEKWPDEIKSCVPKAKIKILRKWSDALKLSREKPNGPEWIVIGKDLAKLMPYTRGAVEVRGGNLSCPVCGLQPLTPRGVPITRKSLDATNRKCDCGEPLYTYTSDVRRWSPADIINRRLHGKVDFYICDEGHQCKGDDTEISKSFHRLMLASKNTLLLTGTASGGKAEDLRPLLFRMFPGIMRAEGWKWDEPRPFLERYGRLETTTTIRGDLVKKSSRCVPGIMPDLFGRLLINNAIFMSLEDVAEGLPGYEEIMVPIELDQEIRESYDYVEMELRTTIKAMLARGDKRLLGTMLATLLSYPDCPWNWKQVGYNNLLTTPEGDLAEQFIPVVQPPSHTRRNVYAKERELVRICKEAKGRGEQAWVYAQFINERDVPGRLQEVLEGAGFTVGILRQSIGPSKREKWIREHGPKCDIMISHPALVETGVDLFCKKGTYNFNNLIFYQCGYSLYTLRQASRRAMRLAQPKDCRTYFLYHLNTMSERAIGLMGSKLLFADGLEGKFSTEGLVSMGADDSIVIALAKSLCDQALGLPVEWANANVRQVVEERRLRQKTIFEGKI